MSPISLFRLLFSKGRGGVVVRTALVSISSRGFSVIASLLTVPLVLNHVGRERYGIWMAGIALAAFFTMADGGVTKGLIARVAQAHGSGDRAQIRMLITSALVMTVTMVAAFMVALAIAVFMIDWQWAFNLSTSALGREAGAVILTICLCYAVSFPATVIREARLGMLQGAAANAWDFAGTVCGFAGLIVAIRYGYGLVAIAAIWAGAPALMRYLAALVFFAMDGRDLLPSWRHFQPVAGRALVAAGGVYMLFTLTQTLAVQSDQVLIARFLGAESVTDYAVVQRLFNQVQVIITLGLTAQWPAYGDALGRGDYGWIRRQMMRSLVAYALFAALVAIPLAIFSRQILQIWVGGLISAPPLLVVAMAVNSIIGAVAYVYTFFFLSLGMHKRLIASQAGMIFITLPLSVFLIPRIGVAGATVAVAIGTVIAVVLPGLLLMPQMFASLPGIRNPQAEPPAESPHQGGV